MRTLLLAGYSGTPLVKKLGIKDHHHVALLDAPAGFDATLGVMPPALVVQKSLRGRALLDVIVFFTAEERILRKHFPILADRLTPAGGLWIAWPKKASGIASDLSEGLVRQIGLEAGLVDNKICAVDDTWSGLRFVIRLEDRPARARHTART
jgi:hypothetical protein